MAKSCRSLQEVENHRQRCEDNKVPLVHSADTVYVQKLFQDAVREANEKARLELKASTSDFFTSEQFDAIFPPSLRYISKACEEEILEEIVSRK